MSKRKTFRAGSLFRSILGVNRGRTKNSGSGDGPHRIILQEWSTISQQWSDTSDEVDAYAGLPITDPFESAKIVWMFYIFKTYFIVLLEC